MSTVISHQESIDLVKVLPKMSHIVGNLWIGSSPEGEVPDPIVNIVQCCPLRGSYKIKSNQVHVKGYLFDADELPDMVELQRLVDIATKMVKEGPTLIHCKGGLNRSGLVASMVLMNLLYAPRYAISTLREMRSEHVLNNQVFEQLVLSNEYLDLTDEAETDYEEAMDTKPVMICKLQCNEIITSRCVGQDPSKPLPTRVKFGAIWEGSTEKQVASINAIFGEATPLAEFNALIREDTIIAKLVAGKRYYFTVTEAPD